MFTNHDIFRFYQEYSTNLRNQVQVLLTNSAVLTDSSDILQEITIKKCLKVIIDSSRECEKKFAQLKREKDELELNNKKLYLRVQGLEISLRAKNECIQKFKKKLLSMSFEMENLKSHNKQLSSSLNMFKKDISQLNISGKWFRNQLDLCQIENNNIKTQLITREIDIMKTLLTKEVKQSLDKACVSRKQTGADTFNNSNKTDYPNGQKLYDCILKFQTNNKDSLRQNMQEQNSSNSFKMTTNLEGNCDIFEESVQYTRSTMDTLASIEKQLCEKLIISTESGKNKNSHILHLIRDMDILKNEILQQRLEKETVESMLFKISQKFITMKSIHEKFKKEIKDRGVMIQNLQIDNNRLITENRQLKETEFVNRRKVQDLLLVLETSHFEKYELSAVHYGEICRYSHDLKTTEKKLHEMQNEYMELVEVLAEKNRKIHRITKNNEQFLEEIYLMQGNYTKFNIEREVLLKIFKELHLEENVVIQSDKPDIFLSEEMGAEIIGRIRKNRIFNMKLKQNFSKRFQQIENKLCRLTKICSQNEAICYNLRNINKSAVLDEMKWLRYNIKVKDREKNEQRRRFETYNRILLARVKDYKKLYLLSEEHAEYLQNVNNSKDDDILKIRKHNLLQQTNLIDTDSKTIKNEYEECCSRNSDILKRIEQLIHELEIKTSTIQEMNHETLQKPQNAFQLSDELWEREELLRKIFAVKISLHRKIQDLNVENQQIKSEMHRLMFEKLKVDNDIMQRDELFRKLILAFTMKIGNAKSEIEDKFFIQRLCNDLKSALRIHTKQNKALRQILQNRNFEPIHVFSLNKKTKYNESYIKTLMRKANQFDVMETCQYVHSQIESIKKEVKFIQISACHK